MIFKWLAQVLPLGKITEISIASNILVFIPHFYLDVHSDGELLLCVGHSRASRSPVY